MPEQWNLLRRLLVERHWHRYRTFTEHFIEAADQLARDTGQHRLSRLTVSPRQFDRWVYGEIRTLPRDGAQQVLERLLGHPIAELFAVAPEAVPEATPTPQEMWGNGGTDADQIEDLVLAAAVESRGHADRLALDGVDPVAVARLHDEVVALAGEFAMEASIAMLARAERVRRLACQLLDRTPRPAQARDLYLIAGAACGLLAGASFDLGYRDAAAAHADAAWTYGSLIAHSGLKSWARGTQALLANWSGRAVQAQQLVADGLHHAPAGAARVRLHGIQARSWSHLGDRARTASAVAAGLEVLGERGEDELHDGIGGEFAFDAARHAWCIGTAYIQLEDAAAAAHHTQRAIALYHDLPAADRTPKAEAAAYVDLATAHLLQAELDGATEALRKVLTLPSEHRVDGVQRRLAKAADLLRAPSLRDAAIVGGLLEGIENFAPAPAKLSVTAQQSPRRALGG